ncbi:post-gpi attachment to proteins factor 2 [Plakobranchus ocellatus]|uniref:Post-gpi attachment to proteins factor 2 n=1 Tax=Plakobranchus ocellatus TaxID=259542 RepID=A0AAV3XWL9_9GAST|nr:post-gpi attachment to proteins factor 2 [Plakobranchus ocellatus]
MVVWSKKQNNFFNIAFTQVIALSCLLPLGGLFICEILCCLLVFDESTSTKCDKSDHVWNFLPSVSQATGQFAPQKHIWRIVIALHATPRFAIAFGYFSLHLLVFSDGSSLSRAFRRLSGAACALHCTEILALVGLSFVSSTEDFEVHKFFFLTFLCSATIHMALMCFLQGWGTKAIKYWLSKKEQLSVRLKVRLFALHLLFLVSAMYFYYRHNKYCENGVYSLFGLCEILLIMTNIAFHATAMIDFHTTDLILQDFPDR